MEKMVATTGIIYDGRIYAEGDEVNVADEDVELLTDNGHAAKAGSKEAKKAQKDEEPAEEPEPEHKSSKR